MSCMAKRNKCQSWWSNRQRSLGVIKMVRGIKESKTRLSERSVKPRLFQKLCQIWLQEMLLRWSKRRKSPIQLKPHQTMRLSVTASKIMLVADQILHLPLLVSKLWLPASTSIYSILIKDRNGLLRITSLEHAENVERLSCMKQLLRYCDAYHMTSPHPEGQGAIKAIKLALKRQSSPQSK